MMERIVSFLPSIAFLAVVIIVGSLYFRRFTKKYGEEIKNEEWIKANQRKMFILFTMPTMLVFYPAITTLIFSIPIVIGINSASEHLMWFSLLFVSLFYTVWLLVPPSSLGVYLFYGKKREDLVVNGTNATNAEEKKSEECLRKEKIKNIIFQCLKALISFCVGILLGWVGIEYQSIWIVFGLLIMWAIVFPIILIILFLILLIPYLVGAYVCREFFWKIKAKRDFENWLKHYK